MTVVLLLTLASVGRLARDEQRRARRVARGARRWRRGRILRQLLPVRPASPRSHDARRGVSNPMQLYRTLAALRRPGCGGAARRDDRRVRRSAHRPSRDSRAHAARSGQAAGCRTLVFTFEPTPKEFFSPTNPPPRLTRFPRAVRASHAVRHRRSVLPEVRPGPRPDSGTIHRNAARRRARRPPRRDWRRLSLRREPAGHGGRPARCRRAARFRRERGGARVLAGRASQ